MPGSRSYSIKDWNATERSFRVVASTPRPLKCSEWDPTAGTKDDEGRPMGAMVDYWESLEGWDFSRFAKNNLILESHDSSNSDNVIGLGSDYVVPSDGSLEMKVTLASLAANARTGVLETRIKEGLLRGVSVGWDYGDRSDEMRNGRMTRVYRNNILTEVSLCPIPADEDGLVEADTDAETQRRERLGNAARELAKQRKRTASRTDAADTDVERFDFFGTVGKYTRTQVGGIRVPARLTRTGILEYKRPDGTIRRELRLPDEVFNTDSLASLQGATVTDLSHHRGLLSLDDWKDATLGHTEAVRRDGKFVEADLMINDPAAVADVENGRLHDISCGYACKLDASPGIYEGQPYDVIQRRIRYNHVAVLPKGKGRAGTDVAIRTDSNDADLVEKEIQMTQRVIRIDGKNLDFGSEEHIAHLENGFAATLKPFQEGAKELKTRCDTLEAERDTARTDAAKSLADLKDEKEGEKAKAKRKARSKMLRRAIRLLASDDEDDEEKTDALEDELDVMTDKELQIKVIRTDAKYADGNAADGTPLEKKSDDYVSAIFDAVCRSGVTRADGVDSIVDAVEHVKRVDAKTESVDKEFQAARAKANAGLANAWRDQPAK